ncbi:hypothetical protein HYR99_33350 [Candidatus Poribacteria bacterium]|nr:hypothetical protein [Candidatus Poribacteria bacterium]
MNPQNIAFRITCGLLLVVLFSGCDRGDIVKEQALIPTQIRIRAAPGATTQHHLTPPLSYARLIVLQKNGQEVPLQDNQKAVQIVSRRAEWKDIPLPEGTYTFIVEGFSKEPILWSYAKQADQLISAENRVVEFKEANQPLRLIIDTAQDGERSKATEYPLWLPAGGMFAVSLEVKGVQSLFGIAAELEFEPLKLLNPIRVEKGNFWGEDTLFLAVTPSAFRSIPDVFARVPISPQNQSKISIGMMNRPGQQPGSGSGWLATIIFKPIADGNTTVRFADGSPTLNVGNDKRIGPDQLSLSEARYSITIKD